LEGATNECPHPRQLRTTDVPDTFDGLEQTTEISGSPELRWPSVALEALGGREDSRPTEVSRISNLLILKHRQF
jgi:hypothetical protein